MEARLIAFRLAPGSGPAIIDQSGLTGAGRGSASIADPRPAAAATVHPMCVRGDPLHCQPRPLDVLAAAYAELGRFDDAIAFARRALAAAKADPRKHDSLAREIERRIQLYETGRPYRIDN